MAIYTLRSGADAHPEDSVLQLVTDLVRIGGVYNLSSDNHLKVSEKGAGADMSVDIAAGHGVIVGSNNAYPVRNTGVINQAISSNSSGNGRKDAVVMYIDLDETPSTDADNVAKIAVVEGTPAASPTSPSDATIQSSVGASNPFLRLADITVANGETTIDDVDILDKRTRFRTVNHHNKATVTCDTTTVLDFSESDILEVGLNKNPTLEFAGLSEGDMGMVILTNDTGARTVSWPANIRWYGGVPVLSTTAGAADSFVILCKTGGLTPTYDGWPAGYLGA